MANGFEEYVDRRLGALERQNRRLRRALAGLTAFVLIQVLATVGWFLLPPPVLKARKFVVVDHTWTPRVELGADKDMSHITLLDGSGRIQVLLTENYGNNSLLFCDPQEVNRLELYAGKEGAGLLSDHPNGEKWAELPLSEKGRQGLQLFDKDGKPVPVPK